MLGTAMDGRCTKLARLLATKGITHEIQIPDISTKEKARAIGLNMNSRPEAGLHQNGDPAVGKSQARKNGLLSQ